MSHNLLFLGHGLFFIWSLVIDKIIVENLYLRILIEEAGHFGQAMVDLYETFKISYIWIDFTEIFFTLCAINLELLS